MSNPYEYPSYQGAPPPGDNQGYPQGAPAYGAPPPFHQPPPYHHQPPPYGVYPPPYGQQPTGAPYGSDEIRTIFVSGFPADVKERELNNLLRFLPGYEASQMNWKNGQAQGFAIFASGAYARAVCDTVTHLCFDDTTVLRCEMARKNMYIKDDPSIKRARTANMGAPPMGTPSVPFPMKSPAAAPFSRPPGSNAGEGDNPPCNTLYVGNLSETVSEPEMHVLYSAFPGFKFLKVVRTARSTTCFVDYEDIATATAAHTATQGMTLQSSDKGVMRVQYSKNPYGKKRDRDTGVLINTMPRDHPAGGPLA